MKPFYIFLVIALVLIPVSCSTTELLTSDVNPAEVIDLQLFEPFSYVTGGKEILNDSLSIISKQLITEIAKNLNGNISLTGSIPVINNPINQRLEKDIENLILSANDIKLLNLSSIRITPLIDSLLESKNKRFGLITVGCGYLRNHRNNAKQKALQITGAAVIGIPLFIMTKGLFHPSPFSLSNKSFSVLYVMIVDADQDNIAFYRKSHKNGAPTDKKVLTDQFKKIFKGYYY